MMPLTYEENEFYKKQEVYYICKREFSTDGDDRKDDKVRDHCHYTEKYKEAAHDTCNLR